MFPKVRSNLTTEEVEHIKSEALRTFEQDAQQDPSYARDTIGFLAESGPQPIEWWLEIITTEADMIPEVLGFDPFAGAGR